MTGLDTNILARYLAQDDPEQSARATQVVEQAMSKDAPGFIGLIVLVETVWVLQRLYRASAEEIWETVTDLLGSRSMVIENRSVLLRPKLTKLHCLAEGEVDRLLVELTANAMWREPKPASTAPDRGDDHLWALLDAYAGSILITGDRLLLENPPPGSSVISPEHCVDSLLGTLGPKEGVK